MLYVQIWFFSICLAYSLYPYINDDSENARMIMTMMMMSWVSIDVLSLHAILFSGDGKNQKLFQRRRYFKLFFFYFKVSSGNIGGWNYVTITFLFPESYASKPFDLGNFTINKFYKKWKMYVTKNSENCLPILKKRIKCMSHESHWHCWWISSCKL